MFRHLAGEDVLCDIHQTVQHREQPPVVGVGANHHIDRSARPCPDTLDRICRNGLAIDDRLPREHARHDFGAPALGIGIRGEIVFHLLLRYEKALERHRCKRFERTSNAELLGEVLRTAVRRCGRHDLMGGTALCDRAAEQAFSARHGDERAHAHCARRLAEDRHVAGITTECGNVVAHPGERSDLVEQTEIGASLAELEKAFRTNAVVDAHTYDVVARETAAVVARG